MPNDPGWAALVEKCLLPHCSGGAILDAASGRCFGASKDFGPRTYTATVADETGNDAPARIDEAELMSKFAKGQRPALGLRFNKKKYIHISMLT